jgi:transcriptional regulator with XRE-family HTH domain
MTATTFGHRLKELRQARGLNQSEVGFGRYSASYVSLLERGLRKPNAEIVRFLSVHLGVTPEQLETAANTSLPERELTVLDVAMRRAWLDHDYERVIELARETAAAAETVGRPDLWWSSTHTLAVALRTVERYDECHRLAVQLSVHPVATRSPELVVEALTLAANAARAAGRLSTAFEHITAARTRAEELVPSGPERLHCALSFVAVLADLGQLPVPDALTDEIRRLRTEVESAQLRGAAAWVLGNLAFLAGDSEEGMAEHAEAQRLIRPDVDLLMWGRLHKASAGMRVHRGDRDIVSLIEVADYALRLAGNDSDLRELGLVRAELALNEGDPERTLALVDEAVDDSLPPNTRGEAETLRHRALQSLGREDEASAALAQAALLFEEAGAYRRALDAWRARAGVPRVD